MAVSRPNPWLNLHDLLALDHQYASAAFEARKQERDELVKSLRELRAAARKTAALVSSSSSTWLAMSISMEDPFLTRRQELVDLLADVAPGLSECVAPPSVPQTLDLLERQLEKSLVVFRRGQESVPVIREETLSDAKPKKAEVTHTQLPNGDESHAAALDDLDDLLKLIENSMT